MSLINVEGILKWNSMFLEITGFEQSEAMLNEETIISNIRGIIHFGRQDLL